MDEDCIRSCNNEEVPSMECEETCCCYCNSVDMCMYRCSDMDNGECKKFP